MGVQVGDMVKLSPSGTERVLKIIGGIIQGGKCKPPPWRVLDISSERGSIMVDFWLDDPSLPRQSWAYLPTADLIVDSQMELF